MNEYEVVVTPHVVRIFHVTAESPERAAKLVEEGEEERDGEKVVHVADKVHGYDVAGEYVLRLMGNRVWVSPLAVGDFIARG
jgi:hypothetical protein